MPLSNKQEICSVIASFLNKRARDRKLVLTNDFPYDILRFDEIIINPDSVAEQPACQHFYNFNGTAVIDRYDPISKVPDHDVKVYFNGVACFAMDIDNEETLMTVDLTLIRELQNANKEL